MHAPGMRARYVTCEAFTNEFIAGIKDKRLDAFKQRYREDFDVLLIDDVHFLAGKEGIQEEFFHTFNTLHASGRQLVLTSDRAPREIPELDDRLRSRFEWGLLVDVQPPDIETRIAILHKRVAADRVRIEDPELLPRDRAPRADEHPRARGRAHARARLRLADGPAGQRRARARDPARPARLRHARLRGDDQTGRLRGLRHPGARARVAEALAGDRRAAPARDVPLPRAHRRDAARDRREFGGRDHTTVLYAVQKISRRLHHDRREYDQVDDLIRKIKRHG